MFTNPKTDKKKDEIILPDIFKEETLINDNEWLQSFLITQWTEYMEETSITMPSQNSPLEEAMQNLENTLDQSRSEALASTQNDFLKMVNFIRDNKILLADRSGFDNLATNMTSSDLYLSKIRYRETSYQISVGAALPQLANLNRQNQILTQLYEMDPHQLKTTIDLPEFHFDRNLETLSLFEIYGTSLIINIANTFTENALTLIRVKADVNKYAAAFGNTPLLLAITKGWNHVDNSSEVNQLPIDKRSQKPIIEALLNNGADVNRIHLRNGMTALHIACLRGDDSELIKMLLDCGANPDAIDLMGRTSLDLLNYSYETAKNILIKLLDDTKFGEELYEDNQSFVATLPNITEREFNIKQIRDLLTPEFSPSIKKRSL